MLTSSTSGLKNQVVEVFFCYAHEDEELLDELVKHLSLLRNQGVIKTWHYREITAGTEWEGKIDQHLESAQVILLLISADFLASKYCYDVELKRAMERHDKGEARVIPVILRPVDWKEASFSKLQALPKNAKPVTSWSNRDEAFTNVSKGIRRAIEELTEKKSLSTVQGSRVRFYGKVPPLPYYFVERQEVSGELKKRLLAQETVKAGILVISAIYGLGGLGKSTLAAALAHDRDVQNHFPDGIFWVTLGQQPDILSFLSIWIRALGHYDFKPMNLDEASSHLATFLSDKRALLVVDDVWNHKDVEPFRVGGSGCRVLVTTREAPITGALRYDLNVMTSAQSLELLTSCLSKALTETELVEAEKLAQTVGHLPLALELAAAQISEGLISWRELLSDLEQEIANLEILDRVEFEDNISEAQRKNYSLVASFNLSLRRLSAERLHQFAWLGVLPDDVTITSEMAATLWGCDRVGARKTLIYLRGKALLLPGGSSDEETSSRLHDLLHDYARNLLTASIKPEREGKLSGLGLSLPQAHQQLLKRYQDKTEGDLWYTLPDDGYIYEHLTWHFKKAGKIEEIHKLLKEETPQGGNGWYWQCDRLGKTANFVKDVSRAWKIAEENLCKNRIQSIGLQCRYALIITSLNSLADIPSTLIAALLEHKIWMPAQGLAYVRQKNNWGAQAWGLEVISKYLPSSLLPEALSTARAIGDEYSCALALGALAPRLPEILAEALSAARTISDEYSCALALGALASRLPEILPEALFAARTISDEYSRAKALGALAPHLPESLLPEALSAARTIGNESRRVEAFGALAFRLPEILPETLSLALAIKDERDHAMALGKLAPHLPEILPKALSAARTISHENSRVQALEALAPHLPESLLTEALSAALAIKHEVECAGALKALTPHLPESLLPEVLSVARVISDEYSRARALGALASRLPKILPEALSAARALDTEYCRAMALEALTPHLPESLLPEALSAALAISDENSRWALGALAPYLPEILPEALSAALAIGDEFSRASALGTLAPYLPESLLPEVLSATRAIGIGYCRASVLGAMAPHLPKSLLAEALSAALAIGNESNRASALGAMAPYLPKSLLAEALSAARAVGNEYSLAEVLGALAPHLPEILPEALSAALAISDEYSRVTALRALAPHLPESLLREALSAALALGGEYCRAETLGIMAPHLAESLLPKTLSYARAIGNEHCRAIALEALAPHLPESLLAEALSAARAIGNESYRAEVLGALAPHLSESLLAEALSAARAIGDEFYRARTLEALVAYLPEILPEALSAARFIGDEDSRARALGRVIGRLTPASMGLSFWQEALYSLASLKRSYFIENFPKLAPSIVHFGGIEALRETVNAIKDVTRWWK